MHSDRVSELAEAFGRDTSVNALMQPLFRWLRQDDVTEVAVNRPGEVFIERGPIWEHHKAPELNMSRLMSAARAIATFCEDEIGPMKPILSAMLPNGERVQVVVPPAVGQGEISLTIRRPSHTIKSLDAYRVDGAFDRFAWATSERFDARRKDLDRGDQALVTALESRDLAGFLSLAVRAKKNIAVVGDTGSGKTTLMKSVCQIIPPQERLVTIEDVRELILPNHHNRVHLLYQKGSRSAVAITPADLISSCMRMKPDRVLLAELRGAEAFDFLKLLTTGHSGSITSYHAESCALAAERYVFMAKEHQQAAIYDADALKRLVTLTIDVIVHVVAKNIYDEDGRPIRKERYVEEVHYDPIAKLETRFGQNARIHRG